MSTPVPLNVTGKVTMNIQSSAAPTTSSLDQRKSDVALNYLASYAAGHGAGQCDIQYCENLSLSPSTPVVITLSGDSSRKDAFGNQLSMARVKLILVKNTTADEAAALTIGGGTHPIIAAQEPINGGGGYLIYDFGASGIAQVLNGTADVLQLNPGSSAVTASIVILGSSQ